MYFIAIEGHPTLIDPLSIHIHFIRYNYSVRTNRDWAVMIHTVSTDSTVNHHPPFIPRPR